MSKYCYGTNEESFSGLDSTDLDSATEEAKRECPEGPLWIGECVEPAPPALDGDTVLEEIGVQMGDEVGEPAEDWPDLSREEAKVLGEALTSVLMAHLTAAGAWPPRFYSVRNAQKIR